MKETVVRETPALAATSLMVTFLSAKLVVSFLQAIVRVEKKT